MTDSSATTLATDAAQLGQQIRLRRKQLGLTQADAAALCGVGNRFLSDLENGKATAHIGKTFAVLNGLGLNIYVGPRGQQRRAAGALEERSGMLASDRLQQYLDELNRYDLPKLPVLADKASLLAQQVVERQQELSGNALRMAEKVMAVHESAGKAFQSAVAQIDNVQNSMKHLPQLPDHSDD